MKVTKPRVKRTLKLGDNGYGSKNITVKSDRGNIEFTRADPHSWGCTSDYMFIRKRDVKELALFLLDQIK